MAIMTIVGTDLFISINLKVLRTSQEISNGQSIHRKTFPTVIFELYYMLLLNTLIFKAYRLNIRKRFESFGLWDVIDITSFCQLGVT